MRCRTGNRVLVRGCLPAGCQLDEGMSFSCTHGPKLDSEAFGSGPADDRRQTLVTPVLSEYSPQLDSRTIRHAGTDWKEAPP